MVSKTLIKLISIVSLFVGAIIGLCAVIPIFTGIIITLMMFFMAPFIIIYFNNLNLINETGIEQSMIIGAISGFTGFIGFSIIFFPTAFIIDAIFKVDSLLWAKVIIQNFIFITGILIFGGLLCALFNAFSGLLTGYIYKYVKKR